MQTRREYANEYEDLSDRQSRDTFVCSINRARNRVPRVRQSSAGMRSHCLLRRGTIKIMTTEPDVGEHWSNLWVVVVDGQPYVRLGDRSYGRIQRNTTSPCVKLKVADQEFDKVKVDEMPDMKEKVAAAMADKHLDGHPHPARVASHGRAPGSRGRSAPAIFQAKATTQRSPQSMKPRRPA